MSATAATARDRTAGQAMTARVMVFAPSPQLTITLEHDTDGAEFHLHAGGQGVWQARMIHALGVDVTICCALGGETGRVLRTLIAAEGATLAAVDVTASNGVYLHDRRGGGRVEIARAPGRPLSRHEQDDLYGMAIGDGLTASLCLMSGVASPDIVPPSVYRRLAGDLRRNGVSVMADLSGEFLTAALDGGLDLVKVSDEELLADRLVSDTGVPAILAALAELQYGADTAVISRGDQPAIARCRDEPIVEIVMPQLEPVDHAGAGDSMSAAIAATLARGADVLTALQVGAAAGALNVTRRGLGTGDPDVIQSLAEMVRVRRRPDAGETPSA